MIRSASSQSSDTSASSPVTWRIAVWGAILLAVGLRLYLLFAARATEEDFYITLRYAENLAAGRGWVYNPDEPVLGTTTPLYTLLLALFAWLHLNPILCGKLAGILADGFSCWCVTRLGKTLGRPFAGLAAALCLAIAPINLTEATKGMEAGLVAAAGVAAWTAWAERKELAAWIAAALLVLLRIDGAILAVLLLGATLCRASSASQETFAKRLPWRGLTIFTLILLPWLVYATWRFGSPVPTSLRAKLIVYGWFNLHNPARFPNLRPFLNQMTHNPFNALLFLGGCLTLLKLLLWMWSVQAAKQRGERAGNSAAENDVSVEGGSLTEMQNAVKPFDREWGILAAPLLWILLHYAGMAFSKVFLFGWYYVPPTPIYYLSAMLGWSWLLEAILKRSRQTWQTDITDFQPLMLMLGVGIGISGWIVPRVLASLKKAQIEEEDRLRIPIGLWLRDYARPQETVMLEPIGYIGYISRMRVLDTVGLVSPEVLPYYTPQIVSPYHELWRKFQPEWILLRAGEWTGGQPDSLQKYEAALPVSERLESRYRLVQTFPLASENRSVTPAFYLFQRRDMAL